MMRPRRRLPSVMTLVNRRRTRNQDAVDVTSDRGGFVQSGFTHVGICDSWIGESSEITKYACGNQKMRMIANARGNDRINVAASVDSKRRAHEGNAAPNCDGNNVSPSSWPQTIAQRAQPT